MAKAKAAPTSVSSDGVTVAKPKPDIYLALLSVTFVAMTIAAVVMYFEYTLVKP